MQAMRLATYAANRLHFKYTYSPIFLFFFRAKRSMLFVVASRSSLNIHCSNGKVMSNVNITFANFSRSGDVCDVIAFHNDRDLYGCVSVL